MKKYIKTLLDEFVEEVKNKINENESSEHKKLKNKEAKNIGGETEVPIKGGKRLDAASDTKATEVELSGNYIDALERLKISGKNIKIIVPEKDVEEVKNQAKKMAIELTVVAIDNSKSKRN